ncbi:DUF4974 domain-containing protein [Sphingomonas koreensis]|jgi:transmembrane sensor|uniref:DUF4974 domain-containing protein n=1 Tax=Sphingomonas koreensis TaxID=93064 RepID=A0A1L6JD90_9SPHN|nr:FecR domain-containing protein [Sphingomonas koreensis]APR53864.1 hypothetical protein BRX40_16915 [Sphingomonas koreensis]MDC7808730.1 FecR domain-containing protein [Sphingomonas koreensis]RSU17220.1 DUF4974 domain-containing protein [Sphingomonas koreensis]RSU21115.1 DUF4974 domain-containing protein [Sphingomonas koreensis]RSU23163.1 DUF4974 domain-containing protein [Sphingomonas koreensis]
MSVAATDHSAIEARAARWLLRREEPGWCNADQIELDAWLEQSMGHKAAFWRLEHAWRQADHIGTQERAGIADVPLRESRSWFARQWHVVALAASLALVAFVSVLQLDPWGTRVEQSGQLIATQTGGHVMVPLKDGSKIELNTDTLLRVAVTSGKREVWLEKGEAYFEVRHSHDIPFTVYAGPRTITVLGTKFSIRRDGHKVIVSVAEGRVRVDEAVAKGETGSSAIVTTGNVAIAEGNSTLIASRSPENVEAALAWREGMLTFDQVTLGEAAREFNRYNTHKIVISDPNVASIRIGGTFRASNVDAFARLLQDAYGLNASVTENEVKIDD